MKQPVERRLAAILAADVAGYSRLMGADEEGTHERLKAHIGQLVDPKIKEHRGRTVKNTGDGMLVEFPSVVDAVRCAIEVQREMARHNADVPTERRIEFRIGINLGDVIVEEHDIFGDGVNVAARLEALAEPGGICISRTVQEQIRDKVPYPFEDKGEQSVKNIARPVQVYALRPEAVAEMPPPSVLIAGSRRGRKIALTAAVAAIAAVLIITVTAWWFWLDMRTTSAVTAHSAETGSLEASAAVIKPFVVPRLSIMVLPLSNLTDDQEQQYFADGITDDLTTDLSRISDSFVIARNTAFTYKGKSVDVKQIGRELGVRYVLEGSVRRSEEKVRVNAQLVDAQTGAHLWAERFDQDLGNLFDLQNEITGRIARALQSQLVIAEASRSIDRPDAQDYVFKGRATLTRPISRENYADAENLFERALALDPRAPEAQIGLARVLVSRALDQMTSSFNEDIQHGEDLVAQALMTAPNNPWAHHVKAQIFRARSRYDEAILEYETVIALDRNFADAYAYLAWCKLVTGSMDEVIPLEEKAIRLSPRDPIIATWYFDLGALHLLQSRTSEAILWLERARNTHPSYSFVHRWLAAAYGLQGNSRRAAEELAETHRLSRISSSISRLNAEPSQQWLQGPKIRPLAEATYFAGLRKAGMPEE